MSAPETIFVEPGEEFSPRRRWLKILLLVAGGPLGLVAVVLLAYGMDGLANSGDTARGVTVAGRSVGGLTEVGVRENLQRANTALSQRPVIVETPEFTLETTAGELGVEIDIEASTQSALALGDDDPMARRPFIWLESLALDRAAPVTYTVNRTLVEHRLEELIAANAIPATEPTIEPTDAGWRVVAGVAGETIEVEPVIEQLSSGLVVGSFQDPITTTGDPVRKVPQVSDADAQLVADRANSLTESDLTITLDGHPSVATSTQLRNWFTPTIEGDQMDLVFQEELAATWLSETYAGLGIAPVNARFELFLAPIVVPSANGRVCCSPDAPTTVLAALENDSSAEVAFQVVEPFLTTEGAEALGILQPVGSFTTTHPCCQGRVDNIQQMADDTVGAVIFPGTTFSLNDYVGERTTEGGYVPAGAIYNGVFVDDVGGGVSQFTTTLFNAAFFAGLDFDEYMAHTIYISRYPYGREATISYPSPDLKIRNDSPYGMLIWPTYTGSSITVTLWSTPWAEWVDQTGQTTDSVARGCTRVTTERTRRFFTVEQAEAIRGYVVEPPTVEPGDEPPPGVPEREVVDEVYALYQPGEGQTC